jgi:3-dehydroquinate synthase
MIMANRLAVKLGYLTKNEEQEIKECIENYNLPTTYKIKNEEEFYEHFFADKKTMNNSIKFVLPQGIGNYKIKKDIDKEIILEVLREFK